MAKRLTALLVSLVLAASLAAQDTLIVKSARWTDPIDSIIKSREQSLVAPSTPGVCGHITETDWENQSPYIRFTGAGASFDTSPNWMEHREPFQTPVSGVFVRGYNKSHKGLDVALHMGDSVRASWSGVVRYTGYDKGGYGKLVVVRHCNGLETWYAHLSAILVQPNQPVESGTTIGLGGSTGRSTGPHLHFETRYSGKPVDPLRVIRSINGSYEFGNLSGKTSEATGG